MPLPVRFTKEDFLMGKTVKPGYYHALVKGITVKPAKSDQSAVYNISLKIVEKGDFFGVPLTDFMSEKAIAIGGIRFVRATNNGVEPTEDQTYDFDNAKGKIVKIHIVNDLYKGRATNVVDDYDVADSNFTLDE